MSLKVSWAIILRHGIDPRLASVAIYADCFDMESKAVLHCTFSYSHIIFSQLSLTDFLAGKEMIVGLLWAEIIRLGSLVINSSVVLVIDGVEGSTGMKSLPRVYPKVPLSNQQC